MDQNQDHLENEINIDTEQDQLPQNDPEAQNNQQPEVLFNTGETQDPQNTLSTNAKETFFGILLQKSTPEISPPKALKIFTIVYLILLVTYITADIIWYEAMYNSSQAFTIWTRTIAFGFQSQFNKIFSRYLYDYLNFLPFLLMLILSRKDVALKYTLAFYTLYCIRNAIMVIYRDKRPNWTINDPEIDCKCGFGKPSGHAATSSIGYGIIVIELVLRRNIHRAFKIGAVVLAYIVVILIMYSRVWYAAHTYSQVIIGHLMAVSILCLFELRSFQISKICYKMLKENTFALYGFFYGSLLAVVSTAVWFVERDIHKKQLSQPDNPYLSGRCTKCFGESTQAYGAKMLYSMSQTMTLPMMFLALFFKNKGYTFRVDHFQKQGILRFLARSVIFLLFLFPAVYNFGYKGYTSVVLKGMVGYLLQGLGIFLMFFFGFDIFKLIWLYVEGDMVDLSVQTGEDKLEEESITGVVGATQRSVSQYDDLL